jgi:hypothetical protein
VAVSVVMAVSLQSWIGKVALQHCKQPAPRLSDISAPALVGH